MLFLLQQPEQPKRDSLPGFILMTLTLNPKCREKERRKQRTPFLLWRSLKSRAGRELALHTLALHFTKTDMKTLAGKRGHTPLSCVVFPTLHVNPAAGGKGSICVSPRKCFLFQNIKRALVLPYVSVQKIIVLMVKALASDCLSLKCQVRVLELLT